MTYASPSRSSSLATHGYKRVLKGGGGGFQSHFSAHMFYKSRFPLLKNIYPIPVLTFFPIPSAQIPVPMPSIPFSQGNKRPIPDPILPLQDPLTMSGSTLITCYLTVTVGINGPTTPDSKANGLSCREHCNTIDSSPIAAGRSGVTPHQRDGEESENFISKGGFPMSHKLYLTGFTCVNKIQDIV